jgi:hypothetical protein
MCFVCLIRFGKKKSWFGNKNVISVVKRKAYNNNIEEGFNAGVNV